MRIEGMEIKEKISDLINVFIPNLLAKIFAGVTPPQGSKKKTSTLTVIIEMHQQEKNQNEFCDNK